MTRVVVGNSVGLLWVLSVLLGGVVACPARSADPPSTPAVAAETYDEFERNHWSLQPRSKPEFPALSDETSKLWARTPVDLWIWNRLDREKLRPAPEAEPLTLVRRLTLDLTGLPPTPDEVEAFLADSHPDAFERLVDRLLASPRHGERWAQHWLDVVRFAETEGFEYDNHRPGAWRYRDYVIESLNGDKPFDRFTLEQLAGDELDQPDAAAHVAVGFHRLGPIRRNAGNSDVAFSRNEVLTEMTDAIGSVFLGLTLNCARCHDHRFDAIRQTDYYRIQAFLAAIVEPHHFRDIHATLLHLLGFEQNELTFPHLGRDERLTLIEGQVIEAITGPIPREARDA